MSHQPAPHPYLALMESAAAYVTDVQPPAKTPEDVVAIMRPLVQAEKQEVVWLLSCTTRQHVCDISVIHRGTINSSLVSPRDVFRAALEKNAAAIIVVHNHPSGDPSPTVEDITVTQALIAAGNLLHIQVMDHVIIGIRNTETTSSQDWYSLRKQGVVEFKEL